MKHLPLIFVVLFLFACGADPAPKATVDQTPSVNSPVIPSRLRLGSRRAPDSLHPYVTSTPMGETLVLRLFPTLFRERPEFEDGVPRLDPYLVEHVQFSTDRLTLDLKLKEGLVWSDGHPLTTADVVYTYQIQTNPEVAWLNSDRKTRIKSVEAVDVTHLRVQFASPSPFNLLDFNEGVIIPKHFFEPIPIADWKRSWGAEMVVYGPYRVETVEADQRLTLVPLKPGSPKLGLVFVKERETLFQLVKSGELDYAWSLPTERLAELGNGMKPHVYNDLGLAFLCLNPIQPSALAGKEVTDSHVLERLRKQAPHPLFSDVKVREALLLGANRHDYLARFWYGHAQVPANPWQLGLDVYPSAQAAEAYDPVKAAALLDQAGWRLKGDLRHKKGVPFRFKVIASSGRALFESYLLALQQDYKALGIDMAIELQESQLFTQNCMTRQFDAMIGETKISTRPDRSDAFHSTSPFNFGSWLIDKELVAVRDAQSVPAMNEGVLRLQTLFHRDIPLIPLYSRFEIAASVPKLMNGGNYLDPLYGVEAWTLSP